MATDPTLLYLTVPIGSVAAYGLQQWPQLARVIEAAPRTVRDIISSARTSAFLRGVAKTVGLPVERVPRIAWAVLQVALGEKTLAQLPSMLSTNLGLANDKAQQMAQEIERELFAPIALEWNQYIAQRKQKSGSITEKFGPPPVPPNVAPGSARLPRRPAPPPNVLNLKDQRPGPRPPSIPR